MKNKPYQIFAVSLWLVVAQVKATNANSEVFETITDKKGNLLKTLYGTAEQTNFVYDSKDRIASITDKISGESFNLLR